MPEPYYLDTSAIVPMLVPEAASARLDLWLRAHEASGLAISGWTETELSSALSLKVRTGALTAEQRAQAASEWRRWRGSFMMLPVSDAAFEAAAVFAARPALAVRAGDALHLAIAAAAGCTLVTLDERMSKAAPDVGVPVAEV
jgi:predicted nucleic acid-binding protein